jgi:hypothetical protein
MPLPQDHLENLMIWWSFDSATDILMAEGWKRSGVFNSLANDEITLVLLL